MLFKIAWKNIWRNPVRSVILIVAITLGIWALIFINGLTTGMINGYMENAIKNRTSHIQIHSVEYLAEKGIQNYFNTSKVLPTLKKDENVINFSPRISISGMISSPVSTRGINLKGIYPDLENQVSELDSKIIRGEGLKSDLNNPILISITLAEKLNVKIKSKVVVNFQNVDGNVTAAAFRVSGIIQNVNGQNDEINAFVPINNLQKLTDLSQGEVHEIAITTKDIDRVEEFQYTLRSKLPGNLSIQNYKEIAPDLELMGSQIQLSLSIMITIFMLALVFGIINTMLMAVLERYRELGMLMAVGMNKAKVFFMVVLETIFLTFVGVPLGMALGRLTIFGTASRGINLEQWADGLNQVGMTSVIHPALEGKYYLVIALAVLITAVLASLYPARKATSLKPVDALRKL